MKTRRRLLAIPITVLLLLVLVLPVRASISPDSLEAELCPCERECVFDKTVTIPELAPKGDVVFAFDLTGSMSGIIDTAKEKAGDIIMSLDGLGADLNYGVMSYMDYPHRYEDYCGYTADYGDPDSGDYAYSLDQAVTSDRTAVEDAIDDLLLGSGWDGPQDYTRIMYESYADPNVNWRPGAKRILVNFGDSLPHDCDVNEGVPGRETYPPWSLGGDPGRDEIMNTSDDLDLQAVLAAMASPSNAVVLLECHTTHSYDDFWTYWTGITGGGLYHTAEDTLIADIVNAVMAGLTVPGVYGLHLEAESGYESWLSSTPSSYEGPLYPGDEVSFEECITVPGGTPGGVYNFLVSAMDEKGVSYGDQKVSINVLQAVLCPDEYQWSPEVDPPYKFEGCVFKAWNQVHFVNNGDCDAFNVTATITCTPENVKVLDDGTVHLGNIPAGGGAWSTDAFGLATDLSNKQPRDRGICWTVEYDDACRGHHVIKNVPKFCGEVCEEICP